MLGQEPSLGLGLCVCVCVCKLKLQYGLVYKSRLHMYVGNHLVNYTIT